MKIIRIKMEIDEETTLNIKSLPNTISRCEVYVEQNQKKINLPNISSNKAISFTQEFSELLDHKG